MSSDALVTAQSPSVNLRVEFWSHQGEDWPWDGRGFVFAGRVVHCVGKLMHREKWTGDEPSVRLLVPLREFYDVKITQEELTYAMNLLKFLHGGYRERLQAAERNGGTLPIPTPDEWTFAVGISRQISDENWSAYQRYQSVLKYLVHLLEQGILRAALRPFSYGDPQPLNPDQWFNECYLAWFATCQVDIERPWSKQAVRSEGHWIYFDEDCFNAWYRSVTSNMEGPAKADNATASETVSTTPGASDATTAGADDVTKAEAAHETGAAVPEVRKPVTEPVVLQVATADPVVTKKRKRRPGRKPKYPWSNGPFEVEVLRIRRSKNSPNSVHALADEVQVWCVENWGCEPSPSRLRERVDAVLAKNGLQFPE